MTRMLLLLSAAGLLAACAAEPAEAPQTPTADTALGAEDDALEFSEERRRTAGIDSYEALRGLTCVELADLQRGPFDNPSAYYRATFVSARLGLAGYCRTQDLHAALRAADALIAGGHRPEGLFGALALMARPDLSALSGRSVTDYLDIAVFGRAGTPPDQIDERLRRLVQPAPPPIAALQRIDILRRADRDSTRYLQIAQRVMARGRDDPIMRRVAFDAALQGGYLRHWPAAVQAAEWALLEADPALDGLAADTLLVRAALDGDAGALALLGALLEQGGYYDPDPAGAFVALSLARDAGAEVAASRLGRLQARFTADDALRAGAHLDARRIIYPLTAS